MNVEAALALYVQQLVADGRSPHTIAQYRRHVGLLAAWLHQDGVPGEVGEIGHEDLAHFLSSSSVRMRSDGRAKKATSTNALRTSLRTFFRYCHDAGFTRTNPGRLIRHAQCGTSPPRALNNEEQGRLLAVLAAARGQKARRDHLLIHLLFATGVRLGSALAIEASDIDLGRGELHLRTTKGNRPARVFLGESISAHLGHHLEVHRNGPLFIGFRGRAMSARQVQRRLSLWLGRAGIGRGFSPHSARRTFATRLYRRTGDVLLVREALLHRSLSSTIRYLQFDDDVLRRALRSD